MVAPLRLEHSALLGAQFIGMFLFILSLLGTSAASHGVLITFSDQDAENDVFMTRGGADGSVYGGAQGLPPGKTATFSGFYLSPSYAWPFDHTPGTDGQMIAGLGFSASISFSAPVEVPSMWIDNTYGFLPTVTGSLAGQGVFEHTFTGYLFGNLYAEITAGEGLAVDLLTFSDFQDSLLDDLQIDAIASPAIPEPAPATLLAAIAAGVLAYRGLRHPGFRRHH